MQLELAHNTRAVGNAGRLHESWRSDGSAIRSDLRRWTKAILVGAGGCVSWRQLREEAAKSFCCDVGVDEVLAAIPEGWLSVEDEFIRLREE